MRLPSGNTYDICMLEKNAVVRSAISFVLQEGWRSLNWHRASSDISYFLDKVSCVPDLECHCVGVVGVGDQGGRDLVSVCLGWEWWGQVEKKRSQAVATGLAGVPCHKRPRHLFGWERGNCSDTQLFIFQSWMTVNCAWKHISVTKSGRNIGSRFPKR